jgi:hypothetical protein
MLRWTIRFSCVAALLVIAQFALSQTEFSADVVDNQKAGRGMTKVYFGKDKMRFDAAGDENGGGAMIMNLTTQSYIVVMAKQKMYMEMPASAMENRGMFTFFKSGDVENACADWLKLSPNKGGTCHKVGHETVNGRETIKYEGTNSKGETSTVWLDSKVRFPVKWQGKNDGGELRNIQEGPQPASLFDPPSDYKKMDMSGMMQRQ